MKQKIIVAGLLLIGLLVVSYRNSQAAAVAAATPTPSKAPAAVITATGAMSATGTITAPTGAPAAPGPMGAFGLAPGPCGAISQQDFTNIPGAPAAIASTAIVSATAQAPEYCKVTGIIAPQVQFELDLPTKTWNGRYLQVGCGGYCGNVQPSDECTAALDRNYAVGFDNSGHTSAGFGDGSAIWALNEPILRADFGYASEHKMALAAKAIIQAFYSKATSYAYFFGCSNGGRQALQEAQRWPEDFNGIIAGAPAAYQAPLNGEFHTWNGVINQDAQGKPILTADKVQLINQAVLAQCSKQDGMAEPYITDPRACDFKPEALLCKQGADTSQCLTEAQVTVLKKFYSGPVDAQGQHLYPGGLPLGSELRWAGGGMPGSSGGAPGAMDQNIAGAYLKYLAFEKSPGPAFAINTWQFTATSFNSLRPLGLVYNATNPNLTAFRDQGGKLILYHGWADDSIPPFGTIAYYQAVQDAMGGLQATQKFARLFMVPGMYHCSGGPGATSFDMLPALENWVEKGVAPDKIIATNYAGSDVNGGGFANPTAGGSASQQVVFTRPLFPYPMAAQYDGKGDPTKAESFIPVLTPGGADGHYNWVGNDLLKPVALSDLLRTLTTETLTATTLMTGPVTAGTITPTVATTSTTPMTSTLTPTTTTSVSTTSSAKNAHMQSVIAITEVFGEGQKVSAVAVEYDQAIATAKLAQADFKVSERTITKVYANTAPAKAVQGIDGKYVIIELSLDDANAATLEQPMGGGPPDEQQGTGTITTTGTTTTTGPMTATGPMMSTGNMTGSAASSMQGGPGPGLAVSRKAVKVSVTQTGEITTTGGETYAADTNPVVNDKVINLVVDDFQQLVFTDPKYGETLMYNLYVPKDYDKSKSYPLVLFMPDASATSTDPILTLVQGLGGVIWATPGEQAKHESFVLAPQYTAQTVNDNSEATEYLDITVDLVNYITSQYNIDKNRLYTTGQSGGCMMSIAIDIKYPDLFAASLLVAGQWDATKVTPMANDKLWIIVSEGDAKAFPGMNAITSTLEKEGAKVSRATWSGESTPAEFAAAVSKMEAEESNIKYTVLQKGTVVPASQSDDPGSNHTNTWRIAYTIEGVRDWLFSQTKTNN